MSTTCTQQPANNSLSATAARLLRHRRAATEASKLTQLQKRTFYELQRPTWWYRRRRFRSLLDCTSSTIKYEHVSFFSSQFREQCVTASRPKKCFAPAAGQKGQPNVKITGDPLFFPLIFSPSTPYFFSVDPLFFLRRFKY